MITPCQPVALLVYSVVHPGKGNGRRVLEHLVNQGIDHIEQQDLRQLGRRRQNVRLSPVLSLNCRVAGSCPKQ
jgi:hypothetical protein